MNQVTIALTYMCLLGIFLFDGEREEMCFATFIMIFTLAFILEWFYRLVKRQGWRNPLFLIGIFPIALFLFMKIFSYSLWNREKIEDESLHIIQCTIENENDCLPFDDRYVRKSIVSMLISEDLIVHLYLNKSGMKCVKFFTGSRHEKIFCNGLPA